MIIVMMMTDYDNDNSHDPDEHVWCLERTARPLPASRSLWKFCVRPPESQTTHQNPRPTSQPDLACGNNLIQALLVLLITNTISADNDDDDKHPLLMMIMMMLKKMLIMPAAMNDRKDDDHRQIYGSTNAPHVPPKPRLILSVWSIWSVWIPCSG